MKNKTLLPFARVFFKEAMVSHFFREDFDGSDVQMTQLPQFSFEWFFLSTNHNNLSFDPLWKVSFFARIEAYLGKKNVSRVRMSGSLRMQRSRVLSQEPSHTHAGRHNFNARLGKDAHEILHIFESFLELYSKNVPYYQTDWRPQKLWVHPEWSSSHLHEKSM